MHARRPRKHVSDALLSVSQNVMYEYLVHEIKLNLTNSGWFFAADLPLELKVEAVGAAGLAAAGEVVRARVSSTTLWACSSWVYLRCRSLFSWPVFFSLAFVSFCERFIARR